MKKHKFNSLSILWIILAILLRAEYRFEFRNFYVDASWHLTMAYQLAEGNGPVLADYDQGAASIQFRNVSSMPPTYAYILSAFLWFTSDPFTAAFILDVIAICILAIASRQILSRTIKDPKWHIPFWIIFAIAPAPTHPLPSIDFLSLACLILGLSWCLKGSVRSYFWASAIICLAGLLRYAYLPFIVLAPLMSFIYSPPRQKITTILLSICLPGILISYILVNQWSSMPFIAESANPDVYFHHLLYTDIFPFQAFVYLGQTVSPGLANWKYVASHILTFGLLSIFLFSSVNILSAKQKEVFPSSTPEKSLSTFFVLCLLLNFSMLVFLSVSNPPETDWLAFWTFLMETRYFAPTQILFIFMAFLILSSASKQWIRWCMMILLSLSIIQGVAFQSIRLWKKQKKSYFSSSIYANGEYELLNSLKKHIPADTDWYFVQTSGRSAGILGGIYVPMSSILETSIDKLPKPLYLIISEEEKDHTIGHFVDRVQYKTLAIHPSWKLMLIN